ncbi:cuticle protein 7-like [Periplaneta americana]|uniref:cuticle protein 7-like n=1 Tax=Periplaneta americana TaxID=6978 RepID=UPI0037E99181
MTISKAVTLLGALAIAVQAVPLPGIEESYGHLAVAPLTLSHAPALEISHAPALQISHAPVAIAHAPVIKEVEHHAPANYEFKYGVKDTHTHDIKEQAEKRVGDKVEGYYSLVEPDGTTRTVKYTADHHNGFNAVVSKSGHAVHPAAPVKVAVPVHKVVAAPVISYAHAPLISHEAPALSLGSYGHGAEFSYH